PVDYTYPSGYVTLMKPDGTGLLFSTFFSGSKSDTISFAALTGTGIYLAGQAGSVDLPGFDGAVPTACTPLGFVTRMTLDGAAVTSSRTPPGRPLAYDSSTKTLLLSSGSYLIRFDASDATPIACVLDSSDLKPVTAIAPGELLSLLGRFPYYESYPYTSSISPVDGTFPVTFQRLTVMANDIAAPLLYISRQQVNFQAPYELAGSPGATLTLNYLDPNSEPVSDARTLSVTATNPVAFLSQTITPSQTTPLILNADGTVNSATNPAAAGSVVTMFMDGLGTASVQPATGVVNANPKAPLSVPIAVIPSCAGGSCFPAPSFVAAESLPGAISGVTQVQLRAPDNSHPAASLATMFSLSAGDISVRDTNLLFWVK
ncbi:MAG TPA: hypothetical protein VHW24_12925, partial [Bryobacteraceae bacterium]|nr:hypothetical protein [Bryobacteraceae bacterium]